MAASPQTIRQLLVQAYDAMRRQEIRIDADCSPESPLCREIKAALAGPPVARESAQTQNARGEWVPVIPLPLLYFWKQCSCRKRFRTMERYEEHYALHHIVKPKPSDV